MSSWLPWHGQARRLGFRQAACRRDDDDLTPGARARESRLQPARIVSLATTPHPTRRPHP